MLPVSPRPGPGREIWHPAAESRVTSGGWRAAKRGFWPGRSHLGPSWRLWRGRCVGCVVDVAERGDQSTCHRASRTGPVEKSACDRAPLTAIDLKKADSADLERKVLGQSASRACDCGSHLVLAASVGLFGALFYRRNQQEQRNGFDNHDWNKQGGSLNMTGNIKEHYCRNMRHPDARHQNDKPGS